MTIRPRFTSRLPLSTLAMLGLLTVLATAPARAQTFNVIHTFTGGADGSDPVSGVTIGGSGTLYGTTASSGTGTHEFGVVFKLAQFFGNPPIGLCRLSFSCLHGVVVKFEILVTFTSARPG